MSCLVINLGLYSCCVRDIARLMAIMQLFITILCVLIVFYPEDDSWWLKHVAEINIAGSTVVLMALCSFIW